MDDEVADQAVLIDLLDIDGQSAGRADEFALAHQHRRQIGSDLIGGGAGLPLGGGLQEEIDQQAGERCDDRQPHGGGDDLPTAHAGGEAHHQFLFAV